MKHTFTDRRGTAHPSLLQASIRGGTIARESEASRFVDASRGRSRRARGDLCILVDTPPGSVLPKDVLAEILDTIEYTYYDTPGSITRGLRAAVLAANDTLFERNLRADSQHRLVAGINCALLRGEDLYLAQLGPCLTLVLDGEHATAYPEKSVWLASSPPSSYDMAQEPPAGLRRDIEPTLEHENWHAGRTLVLLSSSAAPLLAETKAQAPDPAGLLSALQGGSATSRIAILMLGPEVAGALALAETAQPQVVRATQPETDAEAQPATALRPPARSDSTPSRADAGSAAGEAPETATPPDELETDDLYSLADEEAIVSPAEAFSPPPDSVPPWEESGASSEPGPSFAEDAEDWADDSAGEVVRSARQFDLDPLRKGIKQTTDRLRRGTADMLDRVLPNGAPQRPANRIRQAQGMPLSGKALVLIALIIPLVMLFIVVMMRLQYDRIRREQFESVQSLALSKYDAALQNDNQVYLRQGLYDALASVEEGLSISPSDESLNDLRRRILHELDRVDRVERLYNFWRLTPLDDIATSPLDSSRIVIQGIDVYLLNRGSDRVYRFLLNDVGDSLQSVDTSSPLVAKGDVLAGLELGDIVDIAWISQGGERNEDRFAILERGGSLLVYDPQRGIELLPVANSDIWLKPQAIGGYYGNLYVLDPLLGRILKYVPTDDAYINPPSDYVNPNLYVDLTGAVDMAIDGNVYVLFADGQIAKFYEGDAIPYTIQGLPTPMKSPCVISVSGEQDPDAEGYVYVADTGNERIVQFDKSGQYIRQFRDKQGEAHLKQLQGLYVDDENGRMFIVSSGALWQARLPELSE